MEQYKPLQGIKVVEQSIQVAASSCGRMMADWGADVIKVENTQGGDTFRKWPLGIGAPADDDYDPIFDNLNANKRAISLNLKSEDGRAVMYRMLADADVFLTNNRTEALERMGLDYPTLKQKFPRLVMCQLEGYGSKGPDAGRPGYDNTAFWARSGFLSSQATYNDDGSGYPVYMPMGVGDAACAMAMMAATVSAVLAAKQTGRGDHVTTSLYGTAVWLENIMISGSQHGFKMNKKRSESSPFGAPFKCADGRWFMPQIVNFNRDAPEYFKMLGCDDMVGDPRYAARANFNKPEIVKPVMERFEKIYATKTAQEWRDMFVARNMSCEILASYDDILTDEQALANDFIYTMEYPNGKSAKLVRTPLRSENLGLPEFNRGPMLGEHTVSILQDLGYAQAEIDAMLASGAVKQHD